MHAKADAEVRDPRSRAMRQARILPSQPREPKPPGTSTPSTWSSDAPRLLERHALGVDPAHVTLHAVVHARVLERLVHRQVRVLELDVLADERDLDRPLLLADALDQLGPLAELGRRARRGQLLATSSSRPSCLKGLRHEVDVADVGAGDHRVGLDVGEERDLVADVVGELLVRAAHDDVGMDTDAAQLVHRVLRRLRLQLAGRLDERHERDVDVADVLGADLASELPDRLEERQRLDVADRSADLGDDDVDGLGLGDRA